MPSLSRPIAFSRPAAVSTVRGRVARPWANGHRLRDHAAEAFEPDESRHFSDVTERFPERPARDCPTLTAPGGPTNRPRRYTSRTRRNVPARDGPCHAEFRLRRPSARHGWPGLTADALSSPAAGPSEPPKPRTARMSKAIPESGQPIHTSSQGQRSSATSFPKTPVNTRSEDSRR